MWEVHSSSLSMRSESTWKSECLSGDGDLEPSLRPEFCVSWR